MIALDALEKRFLSHVRGGPQFPREWCAQGLVDSDIGLSIYANAYHARLREALEADHPVLSIYLGDELWAGFCSGYIKAHPSQVRSLRHFGVDVPEWLAANEPFSAHPLIAELARFEREMMDVFDSADARRADWASMQALDAQAWPTMRLRFHPSVRLLPQATNAVDVWRALKDEREPPAAQPASAPARLLWRDEERITRFRPVDSLELAALHASFVEADDFAGMCDRLSEQIAPTDVPVQAIGLLRQWFDDGIIEALSVAS
jgi:hypothetical protein